MYFTKTTPNPFAITESEALWDKVTHLRLLELIRVADKVTHCKRGTNNYGDFRFVTLVKDGVEITAFGHGIHESRETYLVENWSVYQGNGFTIGQPAIPKKLVTRDLCEEHNEYKGYAAIEQTERGRLFSLLADMSDEDGAWSMMQDMEA